MKLNVISIDLSVSSSEEEQGGFFAYILSPRSFLQY